MRLSWLFIILSYNLFLVIEAVKIILIQIFVTQSSAAEIIIVYVLKDEHNCK